ncbi:hypothetical protein RRG08_017496 [Elysia crispata]|uniref:G-protein coupled receptors family 3 profile domain-containing protein n=1 Tax=Elysia crispata TaxID=231223 RepID=A0AAE1DZ47_9GAST|nr:hypothetical protein RRG08_017496 [Elysia crispata]
MADMSGILICGPPCPFARASLDRIRSNQVRKFNPVIKTMVPRTLVPHALVLVAEILFCCVWGQDLRTCPSPSTQDCYYNGADVVTFPVDVPAANKFFIVGGFFDVHSKSTDPYNPCGGEITMEGILTLQAFLWGIKNFRPTVQQNRDVTIGVVAFDSCSRPEQSLQNMLSYAQCKMQLQNLPYSNLFALVGPYSNEAAKVLGPVASDLRVPLLSPTANSPELESDENQYLLRFSPSFGYSVDAIYSLLRKLEVNKVILIYDSEDPLWTSAYFQLSHTLHNQSQCTHYESAYNSETINQILQRLETEKIRYLVPLMSPSKIKDFIGAIESSENIKRNDLRFILYGVGRNETFMMNMGAKANNSLIVEHSFVYTSNSDVKKFADDLNMSNNGQLGDLGNVSWITQYYEKNPKPVLVVNTTSRILDMVDKTLSVVKKVTEKMAEAVKECGQDCGKYRIHPSESRLRNLFVKDKDFYTHDTESIEKIEFNVYHYFNYNTDLKFELAAEIKKEEQGMETVMVKSLLDKPYEPYFAELKCPGLDTCCENPITTTPNAITSGQMTNTTTPSSTLNKNEVLVVYPLGQEITGAYFDDEREDNEYGTRMDLRHRWIIALGVLAGLGILSVIVFEIYILYMMLGTHMANKWRTMWLGQLLLFGVLLCYLVLFAYLPIPTKATCGITRFGVGVSYSICFAVLLVKLMVILTSRTSSDVLLPGDAESPNYLKGIYQFLMFIFAVGVQVVIDTQWLITVPPEAVRVISNNGEKVWVCNHYTWEAGKDMEDMKGWVRSNFENHLISLTYIMVLILINTILSLNAHGIITNHRESVFIGIAAGFSIPIWMAWGLVGGLNQDHDFAQEFGDACIAFGLFATATLILFTMFLPKVRQLVNMGVEGIYLEDDRDTYYAGSVIMAPSSYKGKGPNSVIYVNNQGIYSDPVVIGNGDPMANRLRHPGSTYSAPPVFAKKADSTYGGSRVLRVTDDLKGRHPQKPRTQSEAGFGSRPGSKHGTLTRSRSQTSLGAL